MAKPPDADPTPEALDSQLPFGLGWREVYGIVLGALTVQIAVYATLTALFG